ncbi:MAG TPA: low temperature requirement protein A [Solirubrobacterales bacterium]
MQHLRRRDGNRQETTPTELFFDLVYVFAVTQISHLVIDAELSRAAIAQAAFLLLVVWWAWVYTTWMVNWFDPGSTKVRLVLACVTLTSLLMSAAIPTAFGSEAWLFAGAYVAMQVGRNVGAMALLEHDHRLRPVFERLVAWSCASALLWIAGAVADESARPWIWGAALAIELVAPLVGYVTPGLGRSRTTDWDVEGAHFAERFQSFVIIALGESIVITGATASSRGLTASSVLALAVAFFISGVLFWLYFGEVAEHSMSDIAAADDPGSLARDAYTYLHLPIIAGIIMVAVADDLLVAHPGDHLSTAGVVMATAGPAVYLLGESAVRLRMIGRASPKRLVCVVALAVLGAFGGEMSALVLSGCVGALLAILAMSEAGWMRTAGASLGPTSSARPR